MHKTIQAEFLQTCTIVVFDLFLSYYSLRPVFTYEASQYNSEIWLGLKILRQKSRKFSFDSESHHVVTLKTKRIMVFCCLVHSQDLKADVLKLPLYSLHTVSYTSWVQSNVFYTLLCCLAIHALVHAYVSSGDVMMLCIVSLLCFSD